MQKMNPEIKAQWVAALRSGDYKQGRQQLRDADNFFCCLGVLCNLHAIAHPRVAAAQSKTTEYQGQPALPSGDVEQWAGVSYAEAVSIDGQTLPLYAHNDTGKTFAQIADAIESQL